MKRIDCGEVRLQGIGVDNSGEYEFDVGLVPDDEHAEYCGRLYVSKEFWAVVGKELGLVPPEKLDRLLDRACQPVTQGGKRDMLISSMRMLRLNGYRATTRTWEARGGHDKEEE